MKTRVEINNIRKIKNVVSFFILFIMGIFFICSSASAATYEMSSEINIFGKNKNVESNFLAYGEGFKGGVNIALGDVDGDDVDEIITGAGQGGGPHVRIVNKNGERKVEFFAFHPEFHGGIDVAAGDLDGDGRDEVIVSQKSLGQAWVKVYKIKNGKEYLVSTFLAYTPYFEGGTHVAAGDINGDGIEEIITGAGQGGGPHVLSFKMNGEMEGFNFFPFPEDYRGGVDVAAGDVNNDGKDEIVMSANRNATARVKVYRANKDIIGNFIAYDESFQGGVNVGVGDYNGDGSADVVTAPNVGGGPHIRVFKYDGTVLVNALMVYNSDFRGGVNVQIGNVDGDVANEIVTSPLSRPAVDHKVIGYSNEGRSIDAYYFGKGDKKIVYIGGTHAGTEPNAVELMNRWKDFIKNNMHAIPADSQVIIIPLHNPDGYAHHSRYNIFGVDLNRNFNTDAWSPVANLWSKKVSAGPYPMSEKENQVIKKFLDSERPDKLISYHSAAGEVFASETSPGNLYGPSLDFARFYNRFAKYPEDNFIWDHYRITGDLSSFTSQLYSIPALTVELTDGVSIDWGQNLPAMIEAIKY